MNEIDKYGFECGFTFALVILKSLGQKLDLEQLALRLKEVESGDVTLVSSPAETIADIERQAGKPLPERLQKHVHDILLERKRVDAADRQLASMALHLMGE